MFMVYHSPTEMYLFKSRPDAATFLHEKLCDLRKAGAYISTEHYGNYYRGYNKNNLDRVVYEIPTPNSPKPYSYGFYDIRECEDEAFETGWECDGED